MRRHKSSSVLNFGFSVLMTNILDTLFKRNAEDSRACFAGLMEALDWLTDFSYRPGRANHYGTADFRLSILESKYRSAGYKAWQVRDYFRASCGYDWGSGAGPDDVRMAYVYRCVGHSVPDRVFFRWPKVCVLAAVNIVGDRWREAEDCIAGDDEACLFYSRFVLKGRRLPWRMHNQVVMRSFLGVGPAMRQYLAGIG